MAKYGADLIGTKAGISFGVPEGQKIYLDVDQPTPHSYIFQDVLQLKFFLNGVLELRMSSASVTFTRRVYTAGISFNGDGSQDVGEVGRRAKNIWISDNIHLSDGGKLNLEGSAGDSYLTRLITGIDAYFDGNIKLRLGASNISYVSFLPGGDGTLDLGNQAFRWLDIYASQEIKLDDGLGNSVCGMRVVGTADTWMMMPKLTTAQKLAMSAAWGAPEQGRFIFDTNLSGMSLWNGVAWKNPPTN